MAAPLTDPQEKEEPRSSAEALRQLLAYRPYLMAFIISMVRDFELAERVYQDVCVAVGAEWAQKGDDKAFAVWARELACRRTLAFLKARSESEGAFPPEELVREIEAAVARKMASPAERWAQRKAALRGCLKELPSQLKQIVDLKYLENLSLDEIAQRLGHERTHVEDALLRARSELQNCMDGRMSGASGLNGMPEMNGAEGTA